MIHPSYTELIQAVNKDVEESDTPVCNSRYSIVPCYQQTCQTADRRCGTDGKLFAE